ncbi:MAG: hypothetical protein QG662_1016 [Pseudomonadota bacterium]|nr:hypothetical protein [Pseudomonadota bacterium]
MDMTVQLSRTEKGQDEIFNLGHTLRPRQRQILFSIGNGISFGDLRGKLPNCTELGTMLNELLQDGYIQALHDDMAIEAPGQVIVPGNPAPSSAPAQPMTNLEASRGYVLEFLATLVGTKSPAYRQMSEVQDMASFNKVLPMCRKVVAAVASPRQAAEMEAEATKRLAG